jgi:hypothetical protein
MTEASRSKKKRRELKTERKKILEQIQKELRKEEMARINERLEEIEKYKEDSNRMYQVVRQLQAKNKKKIMVQAEDGLTANEKKQIEIITNYFRDVFRKDTEEEMENISPVEMTSPFTKEEIGTAVRSLKNNKSSGIDNIKAELIKFAPSEIHEVVADIYNEMARTGEVPDEISEGILVPLPKPGKKQGPPMNLRPIILLTILRKILAICMIRRIGKKLETRIPLSQAAYRAGRSTSEHIFTCKILAEKAVSSKNYTVTLLLLDMSKAFDTVRRKDLMDQLRMILDQDELHIMKILLKDVRLQVRVGESFGEKIETNIGVPQGDCLSPILFTLYLAEAMKDERSVLEEEHSYSKHQEDTNNVKPAVLEEHNYSKIQHESFFIDQQYADYIGWIGWGKCCTQNRTHQKENP